MGTIILFSLSKKNVSPLKIEDILKLSEKELFWMNHYRSFNRENGYNLRVDEDGLMKTHPLTSEKISNRLKHEWGCGIRCEHSEKLKESWLRGDRDRDEQSRRLTKILTKYLYVVSDSNGAITLTYKQLKEVRLHGVLGKFAKYKCDKVEFKNFTIERLTINDKRKDAA